jgi:hypothetical protein
VPAHDAERARRGPRYVAALGEYISFYQNDNRHLPAVEAFQREIARAGCMKLRTATRRCFHVRDNLLLVMINHEYGVQPFDAAQVSAATVRARAEVHRIVKALANLDGPWAGMQLVASAEQIGVRDGRRIRGRYTVTRDDLVQRRAAPRCRGARDVQRRHPCGDARRES